MSRCVCVTLRYLTWEVYCEIKRSALPSCRSNRKHPASTIPSKKNNSYMTKTRSSWPRKVILSAHLTMAFETTVAWRVRLSYPHEVFPSDACYSLKQIIALTKTLRRTAIRKSSLHVSPIEFLVLAGVRS
jgi:hypothetical protein